MKKQFVHVATIGKPHGVGGLLRIHSHVENRMDLAQYEKLIDNHGECWTLSWKNESVAILFDKNKKPIVSRTVAEQLVNRKLFVDRMALPELQEEEFYLIDLIGLQARIDQPAQTEPVYGTIEKVHDYGAGTSLEIKLNTKEIILIPFTKICVPEINIHSGWVKINPPHEIEVLPSGESQ